METPQAETVCVGRPDGKHVWRKSEDSPIAQLLTPWQKWATDLTDWRWCPACNRLEYLPWRVRIRVD